MSLTEYNEEEAKKVFHDDGYNEGVAAGMEAGAARQKAEDDVIIQNKEAELQQNREEIARLKALLAAQGKD